jgi:hypothetical protein
MLMADLIVQLEDQRLAFDLDFETQKWRPEDPDAVAQLDEGDFPLVGIANGKRYELYSDGTFAEVER